LPNPFLVGSPSWTRSELSSVLHRPNSMRSLRLSSFCFRQLYESRPEQLAKLPKLYETEKVPLKDKPIYIHFFIGDCDWFISDRRVPRNPRPSGRGQGVQYRRNHHAGKLRPLGRRALIRRRRSIHWLRHLRQPCICRMGIHLFHRAKADQDTTRNRGGL
jgi:hypothetical protein